MCYEVLGRAMGGASAVRKKSVNKIGLVTMGPQSDTTSVGDLMSSPFDKRQRKMALGTGLGSTGATVQADPQAKII